MKGKVPEAISIFILPPSRDDLEKRLRRRSAAENMQDEQVIETRLKTATKEIESFGIYDYILVNDRLEKSVDQLKAIVLAERAKHSGQPLTAEQQQWVLAAECCRKGNDVGRINEILESFGLLSHKTQR